MGFSSFGSRRALRSKIVTKPERIGRGDFGVILFKELVNFLNEKLFNALLPITVLCFFLLNLVNVDLFAIALIFSGASALVTLFARVTAFGFGCFGCLFRCFLGAGFLFCLCFCGPLLGFLPFNLRLFFCGSMCGSANGFWIKLFRLLRNDLFDHGFRRWTACGDHLVS